MNGQPIHRPRRFCDCVLSHNCLWQNLKQLLLLLLRFDIRLGAAIICGRCWRLERQGHA